MVKIDRSSLLLSLLKIQSELLFLHLADFLKAGARASKTESVQEEGCAWGATIFEVRINALRLTQALPSTRVGVL